MYQLASMDNGNAIQIYTQSNAARNPMKPLLLSFVN
jgi:hypothetical protein